VAKKNKYSMEESQASGIYEQLSEGNLPDRGNARIQIAGRAIMSTWEVESALYGMAVARKYDVVTTKTNNVFRVIPAFEVFPYHDGHKKGYMTPNQGGR